MRGRHKRPRSGQAVRRLTALDVGTGEEGRGERRGRYREVGESEEAELSNTFFSSKVSRCLTEAADHRGANNRWMDDPWDTAPPPPRDGVGPDCHRR